MNIFLVNFPFKITKCKSESSLDHLGSMTSSKQTTEKINNTAKTMLCDLSCEFQSVAVKLKKKVTLYNKVLVNICKCIN